MYTFLFYAGNDLNVVGEALRKSAAATSMIAPQHSSGSAFEIRMLPELNMGWYILYPQEQLPRPYVSDYIDESLAIVAFGVSIDGSEQAMATILANAWKTGGAMNVRRQDNSFSAVVIDRKTKVVYIISDQLGLRSLHYFIATNQLWVSPHDIPIVAGSSCSIHVNSLTVYSLFRTGWSLKGVPLLSDLKEMDLKDYYLWDQGELSKVKDHILTGVERLDPDDDKGKLQNLEALISHLNTLMTTIIADHDVIDFDLTAGWDTRTIAALLLHNAGNKKLRAFTSGKTSDIEYQTARWFALHYRIEHHRNEPTPASPIQLREKIGAQAFYTNGERSSWRAFHSGKIGAVKNVPHFTGHNTGSIKALYYPNKFVTHPSAGNAIDLEKVLVPGTNRIPIAYFSRELENQLEQQVLEIISEFSQISSHPHDVLDLFSIYERIGRYAAADSEVKFPNNTNRYCLFESPTFVRIASQMHAPMSQAFALQRSIIKRYAPRSYYKLFNDRLFAPTMSNRYLGRLSKMVFEARAKIKKALPGSRPTIQEQQVQTKANQDLIRFATECMDNDQGLLFSILGIKDLSSLVKYQANLNANQKSILGHVIGLETWYKQIKEARQSATNAGFPEVDKQSI